MKNSVRNCGGIIYLRRYSGSIIRKYYPSSLKIVPNEASYVDIIGANYICAGIQHYRQCVLRYVLQVDNITDSSLINCKPINFSYSSLINSEQLSGFSDFIKDRDGSVINFYQHIVIDRTLERWKDAGIIKEYDTRNGDKAYMIVCLNRISSNVNIDNETFVID